MISMRITSLTAHNQIKVLDFYLIDINTVYYINKRIQDIEIDDCYKGNQVKL